MEILDISNGRNKWIKYKIGERETDAIELGTNCLMYVDEENVILEDRWSLEELGRVDVNRLPQFKCLSEDQTQLLGSEQVILINYLAKRGKKHRAAIYDIKYKKLIFSDAQIMAIVIDSINNVESAIVCLMCDIKDKLINKRNIRHSGVILIMPNTKIEPKRKRDYFFKVYGEYVYKTIELLYNDNNELMIKLIGLTDQTTIMKLSTFTNMYKKREIPVINIEYRYEL